MMSSRAMRRAALRGRFLVKVQFSSIGNSDRPEFIFYNEDRTVSLDSVSTPDCWEEGTVAKISNALDVMPTFDFEPWWQSFPLGAWKGYCYARVKKGKLVPELHAMLAERDWPSW